MYWREEKCILGLVGSAKGERLLGNRDKWKDNIKLGLQVVGLVGIDWIDMAQGGERWRAIVNAVMK
jgi:hypothetical protein